MKIKEILDYYKTRLGGRNEISEIKLHFGNEVEAVITNEETILSNFSNDDLEGIKSFAGEKDNLVTFSKYNNGELVNEEKKILSVDFSPSIIADSQGSNIFNYLLEAMGSELAGDEIKVYSSNMKNILNIKNKSININDSEDYDIQTELECSMLIIREGSATAVK